MKKLSSETERCFENATTSVLDEILIEEQKRRETRGTKDDRLPALGIVLNAVDPKNRRRTLVQWQIDGAVFEEWLQRVSGLTCAQGDTVLIQFIKNRMEPVVTGKLDIGQDERDAIDDRKTEEAAKNAPASESAVFLSEGASVQVISKNGRPLLEISEAEDGPRLRLLCPDTVIDIPGNLSLNAESIKLTATSGKAEISASDDVIVTGKYIYLN